MYRTDLGEQAWSRLREIPPAPASQLCFNLIHALVSKTVQKWQSYYKSDPENGFPPSQVCNSIMYTESLVEQHV